MYLYQLSCVSDFIYLFVKIETPKEILNINILLKLKWKNFDKKCKTKKPEIFCLTFFFYQLHTHTHKNKIKNK